MNISNKYNLVNYSVKLPYIKNIITEYDLRKANISVLKYNKLISTEEYDRLLNTPKSVRERYIGMMIKNNYNIGKSIIKGIVEAKKLFFELNNIQDNEIVSIKNDAIFISGSRPIQTDVNEIFTFIPKNVYSFYMSTINNMEIFYNYNQITDSEVIEIKGIKDEVLETHRFHMIYFVSTIMYMIQTCTIEDTIKYFNEFYDNFINLRLPIEYYREFNSTSKYKLIGGKYLLDYVDESNKNELDINNNVYVLRDIHSVLCDIYFSKNVREDFFLSGTFDLLKLYIIKL